MSNLDPNIIDYAKLQVEFENFHAADQPGPRGHFYANPTTIAAHLKDMPRPRQYDGTVNPPICENKSMASVASYGPKQSVCVSNFGTFVSSPEQSSFMQNSDFPAFLALELNTVTHF